MNRQPARRRAERRKVPRIPLAIPVRYATEDGHVGIGALVDVHEKGAGLIVPKIVPDAFHIWLQFLWFDDRIGLQGRVAFVRETPDGFHVGLQLQLLHPDSLDFLSNFLIPWGLRKFRHDRNRASTLLGALFPNGSRSWNRRERQRHLPVMIEQETLKVWAVTEDRHEHGAVLLVPQLPHAEAPLQLTTLGDSVKRAGRIVGSESLKLTSVELFRIAVLYEREPALSRTTSAAE